MIQPVNGRPTYQYGKYRAVKGLVKNFGTAIDVGAHCGLWSMLMVEDFGMVHAFEPIPEHRDCFVRNVKRENYKLYPVLCGESNGRAAMAINPISSGDTRVDPSRVGDFPVERIDDYGLKDIGLIKLDCEGYEYFALKGAEQTILESKPAIIVEQKPGKAKMYGLGERQAVSYLKGLGMKLKGAIVGDYLLAWD